MMKIKVFLKHNDDFLNKKALHKIGPACAHSRSKMHSHDQF